MNVNTEQMRRLVMRGRWKKYLLVLVAQRMNIDGVGRGAENPTNDTETYEALDD